MTSKPATSQRKHKLAEINARVQRAKKKLEDLVAARDAELSRTFVRCTNSVMGKGCGKMTQLRKLIYLQTRWHVRLRGCNEGDYWNPGEGQFDCPKCGNRNRLYNLPEIEELKRCFKSVEQIYDKD